MRRICVLVIVFVMALGTGSCSTEPRVKKPGLSLDGVEKHESYDGVVTVNIPSAFNSTEHWAHQYVRPEYDKKQDWYEYVKNNFGIDIRLNYISPIFASDIQNASYYLKRIESGEVGGLILVEYENHNVIVKLKEAGLILPIDGFLKNNRTFSDLPEEMSRAFTLADGRIWALPAGSESALYSRYYKREWLEKTGLDIPTSLAGLRELCVKFKNCDPNGNGVPDEAGMHGDYYTGPAMFGDVFLANNCYLTNYFTTSISYDYQTKAYEDAALKTGMKESLDYIKGLIDEKLVEMKPNKDFQASATAGNFHELEANVPGEVWERSYMLIPDKPFGAMGLKPLRCYALAASTEDPEGCINAFVDAFYSSTKGLLSGHFGIEGVDYSLEDRKLKVLTDGEAIVDLVDDMYHLTGETIENNVEYGWGRTFPMKRGNPQKYGELYEKGLLIIDGEILPQSCERGLQWNFGNLFTWYFIEKFESMTTGDFLDMYIKDMKKSGAQELLDSLNEEAGTKATYRY